MPELTPPPVPQAPGSAAGPQAPGDAAVPQGSGEPVAPKPSGEDGMPHRPAMSEGGSPLTSVPTGAELAAEIPMTRAARRLAAAQAARAAAGANARYPLVTLVTVGLAALLGLTAYAHPVLLAGGVGLVGVVLARGWPDLLGAPVPTVPRVLLALTAVAGPAVVAATPDEPYLRFVPVVAAAGLFGVLLHQLFRKDGRPRLTEAIAISTAGVALLVCGVAYVPLGRMFGGDDFLTCTVAAAGASALADLLVGRRGVHAWLLPLAMMLGGWASAGVSALAGAPRIGQAVLLGFLTGAVAHALRRALGVLPAMVNARCQAASASASLLLCGVLAFVFDRLLLGA